MNDFHLIWSTITKWKVKTCKKKALKILLKTVDFEKFWRLQNQYLIVVILILLKIYNLLQYKLQKIIF